MMNVSILNLYFSLHVVILGAAFLSYLLRTANNKKWIPLKAKEELHLNYLLLILIIVLPLAASFLTDRYQFEPITRTFSATTYKEFDSLPPAESHEKIILGESKIHTDVPLAWLKNFALWLLLTSCFICFVRTINEILKMTSLLRKSFLVKSLGKVRIAFSDRINVPFSLLTLKHAWVVLPESYMMQSEKTRISIYHELQHHRQGDTQWVYLFQLFKAFAGVNPILHFWMKVISELQELKVDENLIGRGKVSPRDYAQCLIDVAESVVMGEKQLVCAAGLPFLPERHLLKRRIDFMFRRNVSNKIVFMFLVAFLLSSMASFAFGTGNFVGSRSMSMDEVKKLALDVGEEGEFPIIVNELVLEQLNRYIGTVQGKEAMKKALRRMETYRFLIEGKLKNYNLPFELLAVPIIESAYQNLPESQNPLFAAGLWQFIRATARNYGLRIDRALELDERLDPELATDAAARYLLANQLRFKDWHLAVLAYNMGENNVQKAINKVGSRNAWDLITAGYEGDKNYLAKLIAAILIMKNPALVD